MDTAYAIFEHDNGHWAAGLLKPGYRHVWCAIPDTDANSWIGFNIGRVGIEVFHIAALTYDIADHYRQEGADVVPVAYDPTARHRLPVVMDSCVGFTKALLGVNSLALTPWALRNHLLRKISHAPQPDTPGLVLG